MFLRYDFTDLNSNQTYERISEINDITFDVDSKCSVLHTETNEKLYLDTDNFDRHSALIEAWMLGIMRKEPAASIKGCILTIPDTKDYNEYKEYYEAALDKFEDCKGYILFIGAHSYTF